MLSYSSLVKWNLLLIPNVADFIEIFFFSFFKKILLVFLQGRFLKLFKSSFKTEYEGQLKDVRTSSRNCTHIIKLILISLLMAHEWRLTSSPWIGQTSKGPPLVKVFFKKNLWKNKRWWRRLLPRNGLGKGWVDPTYTGPGAWMYRLQNNTSAALVHDSDWSNWADAWKNSGVALWTLSIIYLYK